MICNQYFVIIHTYNYTNSMSLKEKLRDIALEGDFRSKMSDYINEITLWHNITMNFLTAPLNKNQRSAFDFAQMSSEKKSRIIQYALTNKQTLNLIFYKLISEACNNYSTEEISCASYATFAATFSQWIKPENETTLLFGIAEISSCPEEIRIGTFSEHFWTEINGNIFDNQQFSNHSYINLEPRLILKGKDVLSGNFQFKKVA